MEKLGFIKLRGLFYGFMKLKVSSGIDYYMRIYEEYYLMSKGKGKDVMEMKMMGLTIDCMNAYFYSVFHYLI